MDVKTNPAEIKSAIAKMEHRLETEVMPFENEEKDPQEDQRIAAGAKTIGAGGRSMEKHKRCRR